MEIAGFEHRTYPPRRLVDVAVTAAEDQRLTRRRLTEPKQESQRGRFASSVRAEEACHGAFVERERQVLDGFDLTVVLGQRADGDHRIQSQRRRGRRGCGEATRSISHLMKAWAEDAGEVQHDDDQDHNDDDESERPARCPPGRSALKIHLGSTIVILRRIFRQLARPLRWCLGHAHGQLASVADSCWRNPRRGELPPTHCVDEHPPSGGFDAAVGSLSLPRSCS